MKTINGGSAVQGGYYLSKSAWEIFPIARDGEKLPGPASEHYVKVNTATALLVMPVLGGLMVVFLPFIGLHRAALAIACSRRAGNGFPGPAAASPSRWRWNTTAWTFTR